MLEGILQRFQIPPRLGLGPQESGAAACVRQPQTRLECLELLVLLAPGLNDLCSSRPAPRSSHRPCFQSPAEAVTCTTTW